MPLQYLETIERHGVYAPTIRVRCTACGAVYRIDAWPNSLPRRKVGCQTCANARPRRRRRP